MLRKTAMVFFLLSAQLVFADQQSGAEKASPEMTARCREGAEYMISFADEAVAAEPRDAKQTAKRRALLAEWRQRLAQGEDPCAVYLDIQKAATTF